MRRMPYVLVEAKHVDGAVCDDILREFRGFSISKDLTLGNQKKSFLVARRLIVDHIRPVGATTEAVIAKEPLCLTAGARQKYHGYLDEKEGERAASC